MPYTSPTSIDKVPYVGAINPVDLGSQNLSTTGLGTFGNLDVDTLNLDGNVISDSTGTISFNDDNLETTGNVGIGTTANASFNIDMMDGLGAFIRFRSNDSPDSSQVGGFFLRHAEVGEENVAVLIGNSNAGLDTNDMFFGGGNFAFNTATSLSFFTAANYITPTGSLAFKIDSNQDVLIPADLKKLALGIDGSADSYLQWDGSGLDSFSSGGIFNFVSGATDVNFNFEGNTKTGVFVWSDSENLFEFQNNVRMDENKNIKFRNLTMGIYSQAATFIDIYAEVGGVRIGDSRAGAPSHFLFVSTADDDGDTYWVGDGSGIPYGGIYANTTIAVVIDDNTPTEVDEAGTADIYMAGELNLVTFTEHYLSVAKAGRYHVGWSMSISQNSPSGVIEVEGGIMVGGSAQNGGQAHRTIQNVTDVGNFCGSTILDLAASDQISLFVKNETSTTNLDIEHANLAITMLGWMRIRILNSETSQWEYIHRLLHS